MDCYYIIGFCDELIALKGDTKMFGLYFGRWLIEHNVAEEAAFNGIADLTYPAFLNKLNDCGILSGDAANQSLEDFKNEYCLSDADLYVISRGDISRIIPLFINFNATKMIAEYLRVYQIDNELSDEEMEMRREPEQLRRILPKYLLSDSAHYNRFVNHAINAVVRMISKNTILKKARSTREFFFECFAYQVMRGAHHIFFGFAGDGGNLLAIADTFARRKFTEMDIVAFDSVCEFINTVSGSYASELSYENILMEVTPPVSYTDVTLRSKSSLYCLPIVIDGAEIEMVFSFDGNVIVDGLRTPKE